MIIWAFFIGKFLETRLLVGEGIKGADFDLLVLTQEDVVGPNVPERLIES